MSEMRAKESVYFKGINFCQFDEVLRLSHNLEPSRVGESCLPKVRRSHHFEITESVAISIECLIPDVSFIEQFLDDSQHSLLSRTPSYWLRRRIYQSGLTEWSLKIVHDHQSQKFIYESEEESDITMLLKLPLDCFTSFAVFHTNRYFISKSCWIDECIFGEKQYLVGMKNT